MKKLILLISLSLGLAFSAFAQENKTLTVEIRKNGELMSKYQTIFNGEPRQEKRAVMTTYVKEINLIESGALKGTYETVMGEFEYGTMVGYDQEAIHVVVYDDSKVNVIQKGDSSFQKPEYNVYKVDFPAKISQNLVQVAQIHGVTVSYSLD